MCGRFSLIDPLTLFERLGILPPPGLKPRYNVAPGQDFPVILLEDGSLEARMMRWGLIPSWAKDPKIGYKTINARAETAAEKPSFRDSFRKRRCLIPADGYYEWPTPAGMAHKIPIRFTLAGGEPFVFAGLWASWKQEPFDSAQDEPVRTFTILTTAADPAFAHIHDREPAILSEEQSRVWLDPEADPPVLQSLLRPFPASRLAGHEVSPIVNSGKNEVPACVEPAGSFRWP